MERLAIIIVDDQKTPRGEFIPCIVREGERGFYTTNWVWGKDREKAQQIADECNLRAGITKEVAMQLTLESMREEVQKRSRRRRR